MTTITDVASTYMSQQIKASLLWYKSHELQYLPQSFKILRCYMVQFASLVAPDGEEPACNAETGFDPWISKIPLEEEG